MKPYGLCAGSAVSRERERELHVYMAGSPSASAGLHTAFGQQKWALETGCFYVSVLHPCSMKWREKASLTAVAVSCKGVRGSEETAA